MVVAPPTRGRLPPPLVRLRPQTLTSPSLSPSLPFSLSLSLSSLLFFNGRNKSDRVTSKMRVTVMGGSEAGAWRGEEMQSDSQPLSPSSRYTTQIGEADPED
jgi:hypothetical protein